MTVKMLNVVLGYIDSWAGHTVSIAWHYTNFDHEDKPMDQPS